MTGFDFDPYGSNCLVLCYHHEGKKKNCKRNKVSMLRTNIKIKIRQLTWKKNMYVCDKGKFPLNSQI